MFPCEFCDRVLSTKTNLKTHQTKAKYCLAKQNTKNKVIIELQCHYCNKIFTHTHRKDIHEETCVVKPFVLSFENRISILKSEHILDTQKLRDEILSLKIELSKEKEKTEIYVNLFSKDQEFIRTQSSRLVEKSSVTNNIKSKTTITMNSLNLSRERLDSIKDTYTMNHYDRGGIGQADWAIDNVLTDESGNLNYKCTDKNRKNFIYRDDKGNTINDIHAKKLKEAITPLMESKLREYKKIKFNELAEMSDDESELLDKCNDLYRENRGLGIEFDKRLVQKTYSSDKPQ